MNLRLLNCQLPIFSYLYYYKSVGVVCNGLPLTVRNKYLDSIFNIKFIMVPFHPKWNLLDCQSLIERNCHYYFCVVEFQFIGCKLLTDINIFFLFLSFCFFYSVLFVFEFPPVNQMTITRFFSFFYPFSTNLSIFRNTNSRRHSITNFSFYFHS